MRIRSISLFALALAFLSLTLSTAHAADVKACDALSAPVATSFIGAPLKGPIDAQGFGCSYGSSGGAIALVIADAGGLTADDFSMSMRAYAESEKIPGLGDAGFWVKAGPNSYGLMVLYHHKTVRFKVDKKMTPELKTQMIDAMKQMLTKI